MGGQPADEPDKVLAALWEVAPDEERQRPAVPPATEEVGPLAGDQEEAVGA